MGILIVIKRIFDLLTSFIFILIFSPLMIFIMISIKFTEDFGVFFVQERSGKNGRKINVYKFQTIKNLSKNKMKISKLGKFLRLSRLDELPQFFNVLRGDMSLVGPRPLYLKCNDLYNSAQKKRLSVKPGITGWAQVNGDNNLSWSKKFTYDIWYVENQNLFLDIFILFKTIIVILKKILLQKTELRIEEEFNGKN